MFNPLPWPRDGIVSVEVPPGTAPALRDVAADRPIPAAMQGTSLCFLARDVPPLGYRTYLLSGEIAKGGDGQPGGETAHSTTLDNSLLRIELDPARGVVTSLIDKRSGRGAGRYTIGIRAGAVRL